VSATAADWLARETGDAPAALLHRMHEAVCALPDTDRALSEQLAAAALDCLRDALDRCDERAAALPLLAADALITAACEAAASEVPAALDRLAAACAPDRLAGLIR
jgi:hypothetical protein